MKRTWREEYTHTLEKENIPVEIGAALAASLTAFKEEVGQDIDITQVGIRVSIEGFTTRTLDQRIIRSVASVNIVLDYEESDDGS